MARGKAVSVELRNIIIRSHQSGESGRKIAKKLSLPVSTVADLIKKYKNEGHINIGRSPGRKKTISQREVRQLVKLVKDNRRSNLRNLTKMWSDMLKKKISIETTRKYLKFNGYHFYKVRYNNVP